MWIDRTREWATRAIFGVLAIVALQAIIATPLLAWRLAIGGAEWLEWAAGLGAAALLIAIAFLLRGVAVSLAAGLTAWVMRPGRFSWLAAIVLVGVLLRLLWVWIFPAVPASDGATYLQLATRLSMGQPYEMAGTLAYWPPGYPLLLAPFIWAFGSGREMIIGVNLGLFLATLLVVFGIGQALAGEAVGRVATLIVALWPTHVAMTGLPEKEYVVILIVTSVILLLYRRPKIPHWWALPAGMILGFGALIQPSLLLLPLAVILADLLQGRRFVTMTARVLMLILGMAVVVSPWTIRNYHVFDEFVLISTNGGSVLYRANNPLATGGDTKAGEIDLSPYSELEANALGADLAKVWIRENPLPFLRLALEKQILFLGDDSTGIYASLRRGTPDISTPTYTFWKGIANVYWWALWLGILILSASWLLRYHRSAVAHLPLALSFLYFYGVHSIAESDGKYHLPALGLLAVLAAVAIVASEAREAPTQDPGIR